MVVGEGRQTSQGALCKELEVVYAHTVLSGPLLPCCTKASPGTNSKKHTTNSPLTQRTSTKLRVRPLADLPLILPAADIQTLFFEERRDRAIDSDAAAAVQMPTIEQLEVLAVEGPGLRACTLNSHRGIS
jgi:hypothetical protein